MRWEDKSKKVISRMRKKYCAVKFTYLEDVEVPALKRLGLERDDLTTLAALQRLLLHPVSDLQWKQKKQLQRIQRIQRIRHWVPGRDAGSWSKPIQTPRVTSDALICTEGAYRCQRCLPPTTMSLRQSSPAAVGHDVEGLTSCSSWQRESLPGSWP